VNSKERIQAVLAGDIPDRTPVMLHNFMMAVHESNVSMVQYRSCPETIAKVHLNAVEKYKYDGVVIDVDTCTLAGAVGVPVDFPEYEPARVKGSRISCLEAIQEIEVPDISKNERVQIWLEACKIITKQTNGVVYIRGNCDQAPFSLASMIRGVQDWLIELSEPQNEKYIHQLLVFSMQITLQFIELMSQTGVDMLSNGDSMASPDIISPEMYRKFALPYEKAIAKHAHRLNKPYLLHICGCADKIIDDMTTVGADVIELDFKTDINLIHQKCSGKLVFCGNIDPSKILAMGTVSKVSEKVNELLRIYADSPRFILNAGCAIPAGTPPENIYEMIKACKNF